MSYNERLVDILAAFGLRHTAHLPAAGMAPRTVNVPAYYGKPAVANVRVWITPVPAQLNAPHRRFKSSTHRVLCECPACGKELSAGRLHQHYGTMICHNRQRSARWSR